MLDVTSQRQRRNVIVTLALVLVGACGDEGADGATTDATDEQVEPGPCVIAAADAAPDFLATLVCDDDFQALASAPLDTSLPGARSVKVVMDRVDGNALYFQHSTRFELHYEFVSSHLSGGALPLVPDQATFNATEYFSPDRRFVLAALTFYEGPQRWALELSPYDAADATLIATLYDAVARATWIGPELAFHPTSESLAGVADGLPDDVLVVTTDDLYAGIDYQPCALGTSIGRLTFLTADELADTYVSYQAIVVLDEAPNDLAVVQGVITEAFQTPLSHVNVLARNWGIPNMALRDATTRAELRAFDGKLVELAVTANSYALREVTLDEAEAYWAAHTPTPVVLPPLDVATTALTAIADVTPEPAEASGLRDAIKAAVATFGGKAANYSILARTAGVPVKDAFVIPIAHYKAFMATNGFDADVAAMQADPEFLADPAVRDVRLADLRTAMLAAPLDPALQADVLAEIVARFPDAATVRFRTSSNSEDLDGFPCAGCYDSHTGTVADVADLRAALLATWATVWTLRAYEIRSYYGVDHASVGMALLVHPNFADEEANGVAVTANPFDASGSEPAQYVNVQRGDTEVVAPPTGITSDQLLYYVDYPGQPIAYIAHSNLVASGDTVLTSTQVRTLGAALAAIHDRFAPAYGTGGLGSWYGMDVEFKFDDVAGGDPQLYVKQARPYPNPF